MLITDKDNKLNIDFNKDYIPDITCYQDVFGSHIKIGNTTFGDFPAVTKVEDYLYEITVDKIDKEYFIKQQNNPYMAGACSQFRNGDIIARNYDWTYSNSCEFVVTTTETEDRHGSIGISNCNINNDDIANRNYSEELKIMPCHLLDGINDCGVYCGTNVVPVGDKGVTTGTRPGANKLPCIGIPRFVLDNASTAKEAIRLLQQQNIYGVNYDGSIVELHALICDADDTFVVEFVNNKMNVIPFNDKKAIMTNFYLSDWNGEVKTKWLGNTGDEIAATGLTNHADGIERYLILNSGIDNVSSMSDARTLINQVKYTNAYNETMNPFWYSEILGKYPEPVNDLTIYSTEEDMETVKSIFIDRFNNRDRNKPDTWQTVHSTVYDINNKTFTIVVQEGNTEHEYTLNIN